jgi:hypothetical protein
MDGAKLQELLLEFKAGPEPNEIDDDVEMPFGFPNPEEMIEDGADPQFVLYSTMQMQLLAAAAMLEESGVVDEYHTAIESGLETYMPGYPPMSPVTDSLFYSWALCDLEFGEDGDNIGLIAVEMISQMGMPDELVELSRKLLSSRMGIYETIDAAGEQLVVRELVTGRELLVNTPTGYFGAEGMLRFVRLGPPALPDAEYYTELTTPYLLTGRSAADWTRYLRSVMPASVVTNDGTESTQVEDRLAAVFKDDCGAMPWIEFIFQSYCGHEEDAIFLTGIPDDPASLPHGEDTVATNSTMNIGSDLVRQAQALGITIIPPGSIGGDDVEVALTDAQRQAAAELMPRLLDVFKPQTKGKKRIQLPADDWEDLSDLASARLTLESGRGLTRLRNLYSAIDSALSTADTSQQPAAGTVTETIYRMRVDLCHTDPPIWRRIEVPDCSLAELHGVIQAAMGWTDSHLHEFTINKETYSIPNPYGDDDAVGSIDSTEVWLSDVIRGKGASFKYMYDFGDSWDHSIKVEAVKQADPQVVYPYCVKGEMNCPPEDCGGVWGYEQLVEVLSDPEDPEYEERIEWCGEFDPEAFDTVSCTRDMQSWFSDLTQDAGRVPAMSADDFDINADLFDDYGEIDEFEDWTHRLQDEFAASPEFDSLPEGEYSFVDCLIHYGASYLGVTPATMSVADLDEVLFDVVPRKVMLQPEDAEITILELNAFFRFVCREYSVAGAQKLADALDRKAARRLAKELGNSSNFGIAKSFFSTGQAAGFDMTTEDGMNQAMMAYNKGLADLKEGPGSRNLPEPEVAESPTTIRRETPRLGRNDPCHCGSGKKYKKCCLSKDA